MLLGNGKLKQQNTRYSHSLLVEIQNGTTTLEDSLMVSYKTKHILTLYSRRPMQSLQDKVNASSYPTKLNISLPYHPGILLPGIYLKEWKIYMHTKTCSWMFIAALSIIVKTCNQSRCPLVGEWINCGITYMNSFTQLCLTL